MQVLRRWRVDRYDFLIALATLAVLVVVVHLPFSPKKFGDRDYFNDSIEWAHALRGADSWSAVKLARAPAITLYYTLSAVFVAPDAPEDAYWRAARNLNIIATIAGLLLLRRTARLMQGPAVALCTVGLQVLSPFIVYYALGVAAEVPSYLACVVFNYGFWRWYAAGQGVLRKQDFGIAALGAALLAWCRANMVLMVPLWLVIAFILGRRNDLRAKAHAVFLRRLSMTTLIAVLGVKLLSGALVGRTGSWTQEGLISHLALMSVYQLRDEPWDWRTWTETTRQGSQDFDHWRTALEQLHAQAAQSGQSENKLRWKYVAQSAYERPFLTLRGMLLRSAYLYVARVNSVAPESFFLGPWRGTGSFVAFHTLLNGLDWFMVACSCYFLWARRQRFLELWILWTPWLTLHAFHAAIYAEPRYLFIVRSAWCLMTAAVIQPWLATRLGGLSRGVRPLSWPASSPPPG